MKRKHGTKFCRFGCEEFDFLKHKIYSWKSKQKRFFVDQHDVIWIRKIRSSIFLYNKYRWMKIFFEHFLLSLYQGGNVTFFFSTSSGTTARSRSSWPRWWRPFWRCPGSPKKEIRWGRRWRWLPLQKLGARFLKAFVGSSDLYGKSSEKLGTFCLKMLDDWTSETVGSFFFW